MHLIALRAQGWCAGSGGSRGSSSTTRMRKRRCVMPRARAICSAGTGSVMVKTAPLRVAAVVGDDRAAHGLDEAAADGKAEAGAGALPVGGLHAIEFVEDAFEIVRRNAVAFVAASQAAHDRPRAAPASWMSVPAGAYFAALSSRLNSTCSNSTGSSFSMRQIRRKIEFDLVAAQAPCRRAAARCRRRRRDRRAPAAARSRPIPAASCPADWR